MIEIYEKILQLFADNKKLFIDAGLIPVKYIDVNRRQLQEEDWEISYPAILVDFAIEATKNEDSDKLTVELHIIQNPGNQNTSEGMQYLKYIQKCRYLLNYLTVENSTPFRFLSLKPQPTEYFSYHILTYTCDVNGYTDSISNIQTQKVEPELSILKD